MKKIILLLCCYIYFEYPSFAQSNEVVIHGSQVVKIQSAVVTGQQYELQIMLPAGYANSNKKYPVLYVMDSQWDFPLATALYGQQYFDGFITEIIIVGVTWGGANPNADSLRARDYTPTNEKRLLQSGGADNFLLFMSSELFPFIEKNYKADAKDRALMGCSFGGLFTLYTLFTQPNLFKRYVAASPAFKWDNEMIYSDVIKYFKNRSNPPAKLFMCMGGVEKNVPGFEKLTKYLANRNHPSLQIKSEVLENTGHSGTKGIGYQKGLQFVFATPSIKLSAKQKLTLTGNYKTNNGEDVQLKIEGDKLVIYFGGKNKYPLNAASETELYSTAEFLKLHFKIDNDDITGFQMDRYGSSEFVKKLNKY